uniref:Sodium/hydrogen exchanger n=1 Tax=Schistocephalus solidus TaxID=70667 RepID=A0A0X3PK44_SCHSO
MTITVAANSTFTTTTAFPGEELEVPQLALAAWKFDEVSVYISITLFVLAVVLLKIAYHKLPWVASYIPESLLLIVMGLIFGSIIHYIPNASTVRLTPNLFFNILLPPIVLESAYSLYNKTFAELLGPILLFAVLGTVLNFLLIGFGLLAVDLSIGLGDPYLGLGIKEYLLFASLIVAVDPVAVLAIFQDIGVDLGLYYLVFGESLLNDAVTVVLYNIMSAFVAASEISAVQVLIGVGSFFTVSLGGALIGLFHGVISCLLTRLNISSEAIVPLLMSYLSYIIADLFGWSGIISIISCGVFQAAYAFHNLTPISVILLKSSLKQIASISEALIFLLIGCEVFAVSLRWHTGFVFTAVVMCLLARFVVVFTLAAIINRGKTEHTKFQWTEQIICSYGGLRGAVAFSLAILLESHFLGEKGELARDVLVTTTLVVILFTVAVMGTTMKPLVRLLDIRLAEQTSQKLFVTLNDSVIDQTLLYIEKLTSCPGYYRLRETWVRLDDKYIRPLLQRNATTHNKKIFEVYEQMALQLHSDAISSRATLEMPPGGDELPKPPREPEPEPFGVPLVEKDPFSNVTLRVPQNVRRRVKIASMLSHDSSEMFLPHDSLYTRANHAQFARFSHNQASLAEAMDHSIVRPQRKKKIRTFSLDDDESTTVSNRRAKFTRPPQHYTETMPEAAGRALLLATRLHKGHLPQTPETPSETEV